MTTAPAPTTLGTPTMCLLHGDYHVMGQDCWATTLDWQFAHTDLEGPEARDAYLCEVERKMLDNLVRNR
ncbi:hypothetical protein ACGFZS_47160 [Streptomyces sp. NPDC048288]|uniref:hypothetical protein n=1 Tax=Streptomyces sp. NPDC048288 TaxID=3365529 RepID=UPI0037237EF7